MRKGDHAVLSPGSDALPEHRPAATPHIVIAGAGALVVLLAACGCRRTSRYTGTPPTAEIGSRAELTDFEWRGR
jgi:hypothetical protein